MTSTQTTVEVISETEPDIEYPTFGNDTRPRVFLYDELGLMNLTRGLMTELSIIVEESGTVIDVIDLVTAIEIQLNDTIEDVELSEDQISAVNVLFDTLDKMEELAKKGSSPAQIAEEIRLNKRPS